MIGLIILILIHAIVLAVGIAVALLLPAEITSALVISVVFCVVAYLVFAAVTVFLVLQSKQRVMQNGGLVTASLIYLAVTVIGSMLFTVLHLPAKIHILLEIVIMALGLILLLIMFLAKLHIENQ